MDTKRCCHCHRTKSITEFHGNRSKNDGLHPECKECVRQRMKDSQAAGKLKKIARRNYLNHKDREDARTRARRKAHREQVNAQARIAKALKAGTITRPNRCSNCGKTGVRIEAHHPDYSKPLEVVWLCKRCHTLANIKQIQVTC